MRRLAILIAAILILTITASAQAFVGSNTIGTINDQPGAGTAGEGQDWKYNNPTAQTVNRLNVYLTSNTGKPELGLYNNATPHAKLASCTITTPVSNAWNSCTIPTVNLAANSPVWLAILRPSNQPTVQFRRSNSGISSYRLGTGGKATLPATWSNGSNYGVQSASIYADSATPPPPPTDTTPPTASFTQPTNGATVSGTTTLTATATDPPPNPSGVWFVAFRVDDPNGTPINVDYSTPYTASLDTTTLSDGSHTFYARPEDNAQNIGADATVQVTVNNTNPPQCSDGLDNDGDTFVDYPADPGCSSTTDNDESNPVGAEPGPIQGQGYHEVFRDDFTTLNRAVWDDHIWYDDLPSPAWTDFQTAENGILHLRTKRTFLYPGCSANCYPINTITTQTSGLRYQYGYFETRMKWPAGHGSWPGFWLYSYQHAIDSNQCTTQAGEIDVMEGQGSEPNVFYGTVHSNTNGCAPADNQNGNNWQSTPNDLTVAFHTYSVKWTPTTVTWYLDGVQTHSAATYPTDNQQMFVLLQEWVGGWTFDTDATTPDTLDNQIDYVTIWQQ